MPLDELFVLTEASIAGKRGPIGGLFIVKANVDMAILLDLFKLIRSIVSEEDEAKLGSGLGCDTTSS